MKKNHDMLKEYDFSGGLRGKYSARYRQGSNIVVLDADVAKYFKDPKFLNESLRAIAGIIKRSEKRTA